MVPSPALYSYINPQNKFKSVTGRKWVSSSISSVSNLVTLTMWTMVCLLLSSWPSSERKVRYTSPLSSAARYTDKQMCGLFLLKSSNSFKPEGNCMPLHWTPFTWSAQVDALLASVLNMLFATFRQQEQRLSNSHFEGQLEQTLASIVFFNWLPEICLFTACLKHSFKSWGFSSASSAEIWRAVAPRTLIPFNHLSEDRSWQPAPLTPRFGPTAIVKAWKNSTWIMYIRIFKDNNNGELV